MKSALSSESGTELRLARSKLLRWLADPNDLIYKPEWRTLGLSDVIAEETLILLELRGRRMNWGNVLAYAGVVLATGAGIGYCIVHDWKKAAYFFLAAAINFVVTL